MKRALFAVFLFAISTLGLQARDPNIVFILADDMGYGDVHALNPNSKIPTPNLDSLAADGITFTDAHTSAAVCTPTRYGFITGRYNWRSRLKSGVLNGYGEPLLEAGRETVASFLKAHGYYTGVVGKWHLGLGFAKNGDEFDFHQPVADNPNTHGFDYSYIIPASLDFPPYVYIENGTITQYPSIDEPASSFPDFWRAGPRAPNFIMENTLDDLLKHATTYIAHRAQTDRPFFLYFPLTAPHKPALPHRRFRGKTELGPYGDFVTQVDATVGGVLEALDAAGVRDNTLLIYTSDNGSYMYRYEEGTKDHVDDEAVQGYRASHHTANYVFRGTKADIWEAGHHVPFFARWPGVIGAGSKASETICLVDFFATAAEIVGGEMGRDMAEDSFSLLPLMQGKSWERAPVIHHSGSGMFAIREGKWKLVLGNGSGGRQEPKGQRFEEPYYLFDISQDIGEQTNLIAQYPEVAEKLEDTVLRFLANGRSR